MHIVRKPIEVAAWFERDGNPHPIKFRFVGDDEAWATIKIGKIITVQKEKLAGNPMYVFRCQSEIDGLQKVYELKYELETCKWMLFKI